MRKEQVDSMITVLEQEFATDEDMAKAVFKRAVELFTQDNTWGVAAGPRAYGPFTSKAQAKSAQKYFGLPDTAVRPLYGAANLVHSDSKASPDRYCPVCTHPKSAHFPHSKKNQTAWDCLVQDCDCKLSYREGE